MSTYLNFATMVVFIASSDDDLPVHVRLVEELMISLRAIVELHAAAARSFNRPSDWRRACVGMASKHQATRRPERGLSLQIT